MLKEYLIEMEDAVVVTKDDKGKVKLHQAVNLTLAGADSGSFWGMLIGFIFLRSRHFLKIKHTPRALPTGAVYT